MNAPDTSPESSSSFSPPEGTRHWLDELVKYQTILQSSEQTSAVKEQLKTVGSFVALLDRLERDERGLCIGWHKYIRDLVQIEWENHTDFSYTGEFPAFRNWVRQPYKPGAASDRAHMKVAVESMWPLDLGEKCNESILPSEYATLGPASREDAFRSAISVVKERKANAKREREEQERRDNSEAAQSLRGLRKIGLLKDALRAAGLGRDSHFAQSMQQRTTPAATQGSQTPALTFTPSGSLANTNTNTLPDSYGTH
jgi:hypothetical protein